MDGGLKYRGYPVGELCDKATFDEVAYLLLHGDLPTAKELSGLKAVDANTLQVTLTAPFAGFPTMLGYTGFFPVAKACIDDVKTCAVKPPICIA